MKFYVTDYIEPNCDALVTEGIQKAIDAAYKYGGGDVIIPRGVYRTGGLRLRSGVTLRLLCGAILEGSREREDYFAWRSDAVEPVKDVYDGVKNRTTCPASAWNNALIRAIDASDIGVIGEPGSFIDGMNVFDPDGEEGFRGPHGINFWRCENITLSGYTIKNSSNWAHAIFESRNIEMKNVTVIGGYDGFDVRTCDNVLVDSCEFFSGDDAVAGFDNINVTVKNCLINTSCSGLRFGGTDVTVEDCRFTSPGRFGHRCDLPIELHKAGAPANEKCNHHMLNGFLYFCDFRVKVRKTPGNILFKNCEISNANYLFELNFSPDHKWCCNRSLSSVTFENCRATGIRIQPIYVHGDEAEKLTLTLRNCVITPADECRDVPVIDSCNHEKIILENTRFEGFKNPTVVLRSGGELVSEKCSTFALVNGENIPPREAF